MRVSMKKQTDVKSQTTMQDEIRRAFALLSGKWKLEIMWLLHQRVYRFGELKKTIPGITQHMLTSQLRELEEDGLVSRTVYAEVPPRVEYKITPKALGLAPAIEALTVWWEKYGDSVPKKSRKQGRKADLK